MISTTFQYIARATALSAFALCSVASVSLVQVSLAQTGSANQRQPVVAPAKDKIDETVLGRVRLVDKASANTTLALSIAARVPGGTPLEIRDQIEVKHGFTYDPSFNWNEDIKAKQARQHPFPELRFEYPIRSSLYANEPGVLAVKAVTPRWEPPSEKGITELAPKQAWRWEVPDEHKSDWIALSNEEGADRYHAVVFLSSKKPLHEPIVHLFDTGSTAKPLVWQAEMPLRRTMLAYRAVAPTANFAEDQGVALFSVVFRQVACRRFYRRAVGEVYGHGTANQDRACLGTTRTGRQQQPNRP